MDPTTVRNDKGPPNFDQTSQIAPPVIRRTSVYPFLLPPVEPNELGRLGSYRVLRLLGEGGMGMVFEAEDVDLCRPVALKVMKPGLDFNGNEGAQRFFREARAMAAIKHDHLVTVYQVGREGAVLYLAMERLQGETLETRLRRPGRPALAEVVRIGREVATGLGVIHQSGMIHRDIKPGNIWLEAPPGSTKAKDWVRVKILDFGLARAINEDTRITRDGVVLGTPAYISPEQALGKPIDARSDLFSLGCVLYRSCTGSSPFPASDTVSQLVAVTSHAPAPVQSVNAEVPKPLAALIHRLLAKDPNDRPPSAKEVVDELNQIDRPLPVTLTSARAVAVEAVEESEPEPRPVVKRAKRKKRVVRQNWRTPALIAGSAFLVLVVVVVGASLAFRGGNRRGPAPTAEPAAITQPPPVAATRAEGQTYLVELKQLFAINWPWQHRPGPGLPPFPPPPAADLKTVKVNGKFFPKGLFLHASPPWEKRTTVAYHLEKKYRTFTAQVTLNDTSRGARSPMTFKVIGDGKVLWEARGIATQADTQTCSVSVAGVDTLALEVSVPAGDVGGAHGVWVDPVVKK